MKENIKCAVIWMMLLAAVPTFSLMTEKKPQEGASSPSQVTLECSDNKYFSVYFSDVGEVRDIPADDYVTGAVLAQMPWEYSEEALKAQAVAANTYALRLKGSGDGYDFTDSRSDYQEFFTEAEARAFFGDDYDAAYQKVRAACEAVSGEYLAWQGEPIAAVFHAYSSGYTESAEYAFGEAVPYLQSTESMTSGDDTEDIVMTYAEISARYEAEYNEKPSGDILRITEKSPASTVISAVFFGRNVTGAELCRILNIPSQRFDFSDNGDSLTFTVSGTGHLCGMCQSGAEEMAEGGADYKAILMHFYGVQPS